MHRLPARSSAQVKTGCSKLSTEELKDLLTLRQDGPGK